MKLLFSVPLIIYLNSQLVSCKSARQDSSSSTESWNGKWFPFSPERPVDKNPTVELHSIFADVSHRIDMGTANNDCDNGKINITVDWDNSPVNYTCYEDRHAYLPNLDTRPIMHVDHIPKYYRAQHKCMNSTISYDVDVPTFGPHRPLWPKWGEYIFLPKQRWLHALEHGAVVMLYHPCANNEEVKLLKKLVTDCIYRHVITPYNLLPPERPLVLLTWGRQLEISKVDPDLVVNYIRGFALNGPEQIAKTGQYDYGLIRSAEVVSDQIDSQLCPKM